MNRYQFQKQLGDGTYGSVILATVSETGEKVAIKKMKKKYYSWEECLQLREVKSLRKLNHANIVKLKEVIRENDMLYFVFEYMKENLYQMMKDRDKLLPESTVRNIMYQVIQGMCFMHKHGYFHRDLKPENLLCSGTELVKIADFGLARETRSRPPYTDYVSTRWYRAPEVLLRSTNYNSPIDVWALGTIMAELYTLRPLFPGSSEIDQLFKVCAVLGTPTKNEWPEGHKLAAAMNFRWPQAVATNLKQLIPSASTDGIQILRDMMLWAPEKRPTTQQALRYTFFKVGQNLGPKVTTPATPASRPPVQQTQQKPIDHRMSPIKPVEPAPYVGRQQPPLHQQNNFTTNTKHNSPLHNSPPFQAMGSGRRRNAPFVPATKPPVIKDSFDTLLDDFDLGYKKPGAMRSPMKALPQPKKGKSIFDDDDEFAFALPKVSSTNNRMNSGRSSASSAKQVYMSKSRYMPGMKKPVGIENKDTYNTNNMFKTPLGGGRHQALAPIAGNPPTGGNTYNANNGTSYVPSFGGSSATKNSHQPYNHTWKRAEPAPLALVKQPPGGRRQPVPGVGTTGRTDWASKYLKS